jgi:sirohydrochlorin ferrochelatase
MTDRIRYTLLTLLVGVTFASCATTKKTTETADPTKGDTTAEAMKKKTKTKSASDTAYLVATPDRGFMGNEELRQLLDEFSGTNISPFFVTDSQNKSRLEARADKLRAQGVEQIIVLPYFIYSSNPRQESFRNVLEDASLPDGTSVEVTDKFGDSYLGHLILWNHLETIKDPGTKKLVLVGYGVDSSESRKAINRELSSIAEKVPATDSFKSVETLAWHESGVRNKRVRGNSTKNLKKHIHSGPNAVVVPFHLGSKLDTMMQVNAMLEDMLRGKDELKPVSVTEAPLTETWFRRQVYLHSSPEKSNVGVVVLAHGSDYLWNERMRDAVEGLEDKYKIEYAFTMGSREVIGDAIDRLEKRGAETAVVVRVFGMASSFRAKVKALLGLPTQSKPVHHGAPGSTSPTKPIPTSLPATTVGGLEDHNLFAEALYDRAKELSDAPSQETVLLFAHGVGSDKRNRHWMKQLRSLADQIQAMADETFKAVKVGTWREDWPEKGKESVPRNKRLVKEASEGDGTAIVIPARTNGKGPGSELLKGLDYRMGTGFAPHPLFDDWVESQIQAGLEELGLAPGAPPTK